MKLFEAIAMTICLLCCTGGITWLFYDMHQQLKYYKKIEEESTLGLVEEDEEE